MEPPPRRNVYRSPAPPISPDRLRSSSKQSQRPGSSNSDSSQSSSVTNLSVPKRTVYTGPQSGYSSKNGSTTSLVSRPSIPYSNDGSRKASAIAVSGHRRQHSQGFFEPSMPSASLASQDNAGLGPSASRIAAQAAMQHLQAGNAHVRRRSSNIPIGDFTQDDGRRSSAGSNNSEQKLPTHDPETQYRNGLVGTTAAATAASAVFPRIVQPEEKEAKKTGLRRFRPKHIGIISNKEKEAKEKPVPSPNKPPTSGLSKVVNASTSSLADTLSSNNSSFYNLANPSSSTIIPIKPEKDKSKHHGLRQKLKLKDKDDHYSLPLSSANSTSQPVDINNPQSLYSFAPSSPTHTSSFSKSVSGLDLRHGGRALRERKKEEKAQALEAVNSRGEETLEWPSFHGLATTMTNTSGSFHTPYTSDLKEVLSGFGLNNMTPDDAWDLLKAKLLAVFEGEEVRIAVEDLNRLVSIHIQKCVIKREPSIIVGDLEDLLRTGFLSLNHTLRNLPDEMLVSRLVTMWTSVFGTILPFMQAVFLPLDQEFKGRGTVLTSPKMAAEFWGALPNSDSGGQLSSSPTSGDGLSDVAAGEELEVRRTLLISFRDTIILPRFDILRATFSRLSLETINASLSRLDSNTRSRGDSGGSDRISALDPIYSSYSSQTSTLLGTSSTGRSRAASNLSTGSNPAQDVAFQSFSSPPAARPSDSSSARITETVGRMLQCLSVLCSIQSGDEAQNKMEDLNKQLKLNWLGRGRTGRNRKGFVGSRVRPLRSAASTIRGERDGSPTPTPTRQGTVIRQEVNSRYET